MASTVAAAHGRPLLARTRDVDGKRPALKCFVMEHFNGLYGFGGRGILDKREAAGFTCKLIQHKIYRSDDAGLREMILQVAFHGLVREVTNEESRLAHNGLNVMSKNGVGEMLPWQ